MRPTEVPHAQFHSLDQYAPADMASAFIGEQQAAVSAVLAVHRDIAAAVEAALPRIKGGGRLVYVGAGTSGRLAVLDGAELNPTFSWPKERTVGIIAGGREAMFEAIEGAEDSVANGMADLDACGVNGNDVVVLLSASGNTPYVMGALRVARECGALSIGVANNPGAVLAREADRGIVLDTGAEVISGSTRLKAGTAQKIFLNTFSSMLMVMLHKVYGNLMVDVRPTNVKLVARTIALTRLATGVGEAEAKATLEACGYSVKVAILMLRSAQDAPAAQALLLRHEGSLRAALGEAVLR